MYSILTNINNRREWIGELREENQNSIPSEFVVELDKSNLFNLFSIKCNASLITFIEETHDIPFQDLDVLFEDKENMINILLSEKRHVQTETTEKKEKTNKSFFDSIQEEDQIEKRITDNSELKKRNEFTLDSQDIRFICSHTSKGIYVDVKINRLSQNTFDIKNLIIHIQYKDCQCKIKIHLCHPKQFLGIALDFGSEASQMAVSAYQHNLFNPTMPANEDLFENVKNLMISKDNLQGEANADYYQEEKGTKFFKSVFFVKSDLGNIDTHFNSEKFLRDPEENLKILVDKSSGKMLTQDDNKHYQLPNLKIIHGHHDILDDIKFRITKNNYPASVSLNRMAEKIHNSVLQYLLESYIQKDFAINEEERYVRVTLLVPNIYDSESVLAIQNNIREILANFQRKHIGAILGYEVLTISESDAALVGYMSKPDVNIQPDKQYIVIDAGKGTTDFSVVKTGHEDIFKIIPVYRNGFAGAGNLVTNAIFETLIHYIREQNKRNDDVQHAIETKILEPLRNDVALRNEFFNELEKLKKKYTENKNIISQWHNAGSGNIKLKDITQSGVDINTIIDILKRIEGVADFYQYIEVATEVITEKVVSSLEILKNSMDEIYYEGVILTGRGFMFHPLYNKLQQKITDRLKINKQHIFLLKNNELKDVCIKGVFNRSMQTNSEVIGYPIQKIRTQREQKQQASSTDHKPKTSFLEKVKKLLGSIEGEDTTYVFSQNNTLKANQLKNSTFQIGAKSYSIPNDDHFYSSLQQHSVLNIEYTSHGYILRHLLNGKLVRVTGLQNTFELANADKNIIIPSLFPNYINTDYLESMYAQLPAIATSSPVDTPQSTPKSTFDELKF